MVSVMFDLKTQVFRYNQSSRRKIRVKFWNNCGEIAFHVCIKGCAEKEAKSGKCVIGIKSLTNKRFLKMVKGNNFGIIKTFIYI